MSVTQIGLKCISVTSLGEDSSRMDVVEGHEPSDRVREEIDAMLDSGPQSTQTSRIIREEAEANNELSDEEDSADEEGKDEEQQGFW